MKWMMKLGVSAGILAVGFFGMQTIASSGQEAPEKEKLDTRPTVKIQRLETESFAVNIESFGEVTPLEATNLSAQVNGEVVSWNENFVSGGIVKRGDVLFTIEKETYEAALLQAQASLAQAEAKLIEEKALAEVAKREASTMPDARVTDLYLRKPQILSAQAQVKAAQAALRIAKRDLANCEITAPYDALVVSRSIGKGEFVSTGAQVAVLNNIESAEILFPIARFDQAFLPENLYGAKTTISLVNRQDDSVTRTGQINRDTGIVDEATRMSHLVARVEDPYGLRSNQPVLKFGSYVKVAFRGKVLDSVFKVPQELINKRQIWLLDDDNKMFSKKVNVLREEGSYFLLQGDIQPDSRAVLTLPEYPQNGMEVKINDGKEDLVAQSPQ